MEVIEAIDGPLETAGEPSPAGQPADVQQLLQTALRQVTDTARHQLEAIKLSQLLPPPVMPPAVRVEEQSIEESAKEPAETRHES